MLRLSYPFVKDFLRPFKDFVKAFLRDSYGFQGLFFGIPTSYAQPEADRSWGSGLSLRLTAMIAIKNAICPKECKIASK